MRATAFAAAVLAAALVWVPRWADAHDSGGNSSSSDNSNYAAGLKLAKAGQCQNAIPQFNLALQANSKDANALNMLGFCNRKLGNFPASLDDYNKALAIDPKHRGAHEYLGELYLDMKQPDKAQAELKTLDDLCTFGCEEYDDLKKAITAYNSGHRPAGGY
jgi:tetratricopeptide (TPR) repeat protein